jgi:hypothetical protein
MYREEKKIGNVIVTKEGENFISKILSKKFLKETDQTLLDANIAWYKETMITILNIELVKPTNSVRRRQAKLQKIKEKSLEFYNHRRLKKEAGEAVTKKVTKEEFSLKSFKKVIHSVINNTTRSFERVDVVNCQDYFHVDFLLFCKNTV